MPLRRLGIVGTGLIGASIGLAAKRAGVAEVVGVDADEAAAQLALERGAIDRATEDVEADLVVVAVPSSAFAGVVSDLPGDCPMLSLTKGLDPDSGRRLSTLVAGRPC